MGLTATASCMYKLHGHGHFTVLHPDDGSIPVREEISERLPVTCTQAVVFGYNKPGVGQRLTFMRSSFGRCNQDSS